PLGCRVGNLLIYHQYYQQVAALHPHRSRTLTDSGINNPGTLSMINWQFNRLLVCRAKKSRPGAPPALFEKLFGPQGFIAKKLHNSLILTR
ncbi:MAG: hypothetical protein P1P81_01120, partial [Desulfobulbales bacterium]|nr:hypothetical protein [Desulfobulbales bacterium]